MVKEEDGGEGVDAVGADEGALPALAVAGGGPLGNAEAFHDLADGSGVLVERNGGDGEFVGGELGEGSAEILDPKQAGKRFGGPKNEQDDPTAAGVDIEATALDRRKFERKGFVQKLEALEVVGDAAVQGGLAGEAAGFVEKFAFQRRVVVADGGDLNEQSGGAAVAGVAVLKISGGGNDVAAAFVFLPLQALHQQRNTAESCLGTDFARGGWFLF